MRWLKTWLVAALAAWPASAYGQFNDVAVLQGLDARGQRAARERAVARVGPVARQLVEAYGNDAVAALFGCSKDMGGKLARFHDSGELAKLPDPGWLLAVAGRHGDAVVKFALEHRAELADPWRYGVFLKDPLPYALALKKLDAGVAEYKQAHEKRRQKYESEQHTLNVNLAIYGGFFLAALVLWRLRRGWYA